MSKPIKVLFIYPPVRLSEKARIPPVGYMYMASVLEEEGIEVEILDVNLLRLPVEELMQLIRGKQFDVLGIGGMTTVYYYMKMLSLELKREYPDIPIIGGGSACSSTPEVAIENTGLDVVCIGEGEPIIVDLVNSLAAGESVQHIEGIAYQQPNGKAVLTAPRSRMGDLSDLPYPAYHLVDMDEYLKNNATKYASSKEMRDFADARGIDQERARRAVFMYTKRGCPFGCTFCYRNFGRKVEYNSVDYVIEHMEFVAEKYNTSHFIFGDELFNVNRHWVQEFCEKIIAGPNKYILSAGNGLRANCTDDESLKLMREAGFIRVGIGIESFYEPSLKEMKKNQTVEQITTALQAVQDNDMMIGSTVLLFGFKSDGMEAMQANVKWLAKLGLYDAAFVIPCPYPGTVMYDEAKDLGLITDEEGWLMELSDKDVSERVINLSGRPPEELNEIIEWGRSELQVKKVAASYPTVGKVLDLIQQPLRKTLGIDVTGRILDLRRKMVAKKKSVIGVPIAAVALNGADDSYLLDEAMEYLKKWENAPLPRSGVKLEGEASMPAAVVVGHAIPVNKLSGTSDNMRIPDTF